MMTQATAERYRAFRAPERVRTFDGYRPLDEDLVRTLRLRDEAQNREAHQSAVKLIDSLIHDWCGRHVSVCVCQLPEPRRTK